MTNSNDDYVYDEVSGEWRPASGVTAAAQGQALEVREASPAPCSRTAMPSF